MIVEKLRSAQEGPEEIAQNLLANRADSLLHAPYQMRHAARISLLFAKEPLRFGKVVATRRVSPSTPVPSPSRRRASQEGEGGVKVEGCGFDKPFRITEKNRQGEKTRKIF
jgi:hypothetical protein